MSETKQIAKRILKPDKRQEEFIALMVDGLDCQDARLGGLKPLGVPLSLDEAAQVIGIRMRHARRWLADPVIKAAMAKAVADRRGAAQPMVLAQLELIAGSPIVDPKPSDIIKAGQILLGEDSKGFSVNVQVNNQTNIANPIRPGYVLDLSAMKAKPAQPIIEGEVEVDDWPNSGGP